MLMSGLNEVFVQFIKEESVLCCWHVWRREDSHVLRGMLYFQLVGEIREQTLL